MSQQDVPEPEQVTGVPSEETPSFAMKGRQRETVELESLPPEQVLERLDLDRQGLAAVREAALRGDPPGAFSALLQYYRERYPLAEPPAAGQGSLSVAEEITRHIFQFGPYEKAAYGDEMDWEWDPRGDIEWVAVMYRFYWAGILTSAFQATRDEKYARAFVKLATDWIAKHPLQRHAKAHPVYTSWKGFAWLDIQTGIRATNLCAAFRGLVCAQAFTPEFLGIFLASIYDHQVKTEKMPMGMVHNKAVFEQRGFINVAHTFPEFRQSRDWLELGFQRTREVFLAQTTPDGVQREWSFGYHLGVLRDAVEITERMQAADIAVPEDYRERVRGMFDYVFAVATPELAGPMFGDGSRSARTTAERSGWPLYSVLMEGARLFAEPKYEALARLDAEHLPQQTSFAFPHAGIYVLRNRWDTQQIYLALHCSPPAISSHDQPDNGTFELAAYGRWLMPDTGFFTYGHDPEKRAWHRQTRVHQTLTLEGEDTADRGRHLLWDSVAQGDTLVVENASYTDLVHRRTVWFVDKRFFVFLDEAIGHAPGTLELHFQFAPGGVRVEVADKMAWTLFDDANVLVRAGSGMAVEMAEEEGWFAPTYGVREPRPAVCFRHLGSAPQCFLTLVAPYQGTQPPTAEILASPTLESGRECVELEVSMGAETWKVGRDLVAGSAWQNRIKGG